MVYDILKCVFEVLHIRHELYVLDIKMARDFCRVFNFRIFLYAKGDRKGFYSGIELA
ncbi:hypothetical protein SDC9_139246 [bioreactor metagenome]|uniref:Uncharacterized protein n=1 Tax=bioreactor metagenome TaxID=1076179 RepID=A0A645DUU0_9ZZZZ